MIIKIDWISFTVALEPAEDWNELDAVYAAGAAILDLSEQIPDWLRLREALEPGDGRAPYRNSWRGSMPGVVIMTGPTLPHALVEISGRACAILALNQTLLPLLAVVQDNLTRLDIACDMLTDTDPVEFANSRLPGRFKSHSEFVSASGSTAYVGSRTSDRYARVYRYNEPHERAHLLRCEYVVKKENARLTAASVLANGLDNVAAAMGNQFGWTHPDWIVEDPDEIELKMHRPERREGKTLYWLADTVAPLLVRLQQEGILDVQEWLDTHVKTHLS